MCASPEVSSRAVSGLKLKGLACSAMKKKQEKQLYAHVLLLMEWIVWPRQLVDHLRVFIVAFYPIYYDAKDKYDW